jgi:hypothetical protein
VEFNPQKVLMSIF